MPQTHYVTHRSYQMQKYKFSVSCRNALFMGCTLGPLEHQKYCVDVPHHGCTKMHYVIHGSHLMQKYKIDVTCLGAHFMGPVVGPPGQEK
jgi:hypothetical protein